MDLFSITKEPPQGSPMWAYGFASIFDHRRPWIIGGMIFILLSMVVFIGVGFHAALPVTAQTFFIVTRPTIAQSSLSQHIQKTLPLSWQKALDTSSSWPVLLGAGLGPNGWEWFAVVPRWRYADGIATTSAGLTRIFHDQDVVQPTSRVSYGAVLSTWLHAPRADAVGQFALNAISTSSSLITFSYHDHIVRTSLAFEKHLSPFIPRRADVSLDLSSLTGLAREEALAALPIPGFTRFASLKELHLVFGEHGSPEEVQIVHTESLDATKTTQILAGFGITAKRVIQLGDGTLATELTTPSGDMTQPVHINTHDTLLVQDREIRYGSSTEPLPSLSLACNDAPVAGRLSPNALQKLAQSIGLVFVPSMLHGWQLGEASDGAMILCEE